MDLLQPSRYRPELLRGLLALLPFDQEHTSRRGGPFELNLRAASLFNSRGQRTGRRTEAGDGTWKNTQFGDMKEGLTCAFVPGVERIMQSSMCTSVLYCGRGQRG